VFAEERVLDAIHAMIVKENYTDKLVDTQASIPRQSSEEKGPAARTRRKSSSKRNGAAKAKRKKRRWWNRDFPKSKPGGLNSNRTGRLLKTPTT
ncbi:MAG: hypothetical protein PHT84_04145, partial [Candidatus Pacebacteria bacterium]|nr:hypothetical protein [Candidatus Paceibacterota bacterium]